MTQCADPVRAVVIDQLQAAVRGKEDLFMEERWDYGYGGEQIKSVELNEYAIAEWAWGLLERQREQMIKAVEAALNDNDGTDA